MLYVCSILEQIYTFTAFVVAYFSTLKRETYSEPRQTTKGDALVGTVNCLILWAVCAKTPPQIFDWVLYATLHYPNVKAES